MVLFPNTHKIKFTLFFLLHLVFNYEVNAEEIKVLHFSKDSGTLISFVQSIEANSNYIFSYTNKIDLGKSVKLPSSTLTLTQFLDVISTTCGVDYSIIQNRIILEPKRNRTRVIYGQVTASEGNEWLIGAYVIDLKTMKSISTNGYGYYSIKIDGNDSFELGFSYLGYNSKIIRLNPSKDTLLNIQLTSNILLDEVSVESEKLVSISNAQMSSIVLTSTQIQKIPSFFGENDLVKTISLLPGISSGSEGFSGLNVRGGSNDQNLVLLDDVPLYGITHMLGLFSVFNSDAINQVTVLKGGFPARYGGRASSVIDLKLMEGNNERLKGLASIGLSSAKLSFDGPLVKNKSTFSLSLRRTFHDMLEFNIPFSTTGNWNFYFYDLYGKVNHMFSDRSRLFFSFFSSKDNFFTKYNYQEYLSGDQTPTTIGVSDENNAYWGNLLGSLRWNYLINKQLFVNSQLAYSRFKYEYNTTEYDVLNQGVLTSNSSYFSGVHDFIGKIDFDYRPSINHTLRFGINSTAHTFQPGIETSRQLVEADIAIDTIFGGNPIRGVELHGYLEDDWTISRRLKANLGIRLVTYFASGSTYLTPEPRAALRFAFSPKIVAKTAFSSTSQFLHLVNSSSISLPTDLWFPVTEDIKPVYSELYSVGGEWNIFKSLIFSVEGYYKELHNILEVKDGGGIYGVSTNLSDFLTAGEGVSKGVELFAQIKERHFQGWLGYTFSNTEHQFDEIDNNDPFPARNDHRHSVSISTSYEFKSGWEFGINWVYNTGSPITLPTQKYYSPTMPTSFNSSGINNSVDLISSRNGYRMTPYHRMDLSLTHSKRKWWGERIWNIGIYNAYGHQNPFILYTKDMQNQDGTITRKLQQLSVVPIPVPYIRFTAKF